MHICIEPDDLDAWVRRGERQFYGERTSRLRLDLIDQLELDSYDQQWEWQRNRQLHRGRQHQRQLAFRHYHGRWAILYGEPIRSHLHLCFYSDDSDTWLRGRKRQLHRERAGGLQSASGQARRQTQRNASMALLQQLGDGLGRLGFGGTQRCDGRRRIGDERVEIRASPSRFR